MHAVVTEPDIDERAPEPPTRWKPGTRLLFRFSFLYFGLFCVVYPQPLYAFLGPLAQWLPDDWVLKSSTLPRPLVEWVGRVVFGNDSLLDFTSGSGDQPYLWVLVFCILVVAVTGTLLWTLLDRRRPDYRRLAGWFLLFIRLCLAGQMLGYGFAKMIPTQMQEPALATLVKPYGDFTLMAVLWNQVGASPPYEILLGIAEVIAGLLLLVPRTAFAGVLLSLVSMAQVWILNMTFDVPVKLLSFHLLLLSVVLLAPDARRLILMLTGHAVGPSTAPQPFHTPRARRIALIAQLALAAWFLAAQCIGSWHAWHEWGPGRPKSELYGIWNVSEFVRDGQPVPPLTTDETRWRRIIFEEVPYSDYQRMDDSLVQVLTDIDTGAHTLTLSAMPADPAGAETPSAVGTFTYDRSAPDHMVLTGELGGSPVTMTLERVDLDRYPMREFKIRLVQ
ncbi:DoxX family protein [Nocardia jejuensis]|uniref:DoxX family protein n=1 Tax=Nocardia jejuensis TaxID=328049 RepID=UPI00082E0DFB|nr:DoxX family protein [Nocardia jejuensis]